MAARAPAAVTLLKAMANERRLFILCYLHQHQEATVNTLVEALGMSQSALSQHLAWLRRDGLVQTRKVGLQVYYRLNSEVAMSVMGVLHQHFCALDADDTSLAE
ncbi:ArsR/SmtB family transcription factor [Vibrio stylophorae]|nr:metalloregulator ArsR/SmtB family transcription factor [Vibrio stylophorae]